jgi:branched-chain amino acid transport system substrate-binding protein
MSESRVWPVLFCLTIAAVGCDDVERPQKGDVRTILASVPQTGALSYLGGSLAHSLKLAVLEINEGGGVLDTPLDLQLADSHSDSEVGVKEAVFFYDLNPKQTDGIVGDVLDEVSKGLLMEIARHGERIPIVSPGASSPDFIEMFDQFDIFFRTVPSSQHQGEILAGKATKMGYGSGVVISEDDKYGERLGEVFAEKYTEGRTDLVVETYSPESPTEVLKAVAIACSKNPTFILLIMYGDHGKVMLNEWARTCPKVPLLTTERLMSDRFLATLDPATLTALNEVAVNGVYPAADRTRGGYKAFAQHYCDRYVEDCDESEVVPRTPVFTPNAYDAVYLIALAIQKAGILDEDAVTKGKGWDVDQITTAMRAVASSSAAGSEEILPGEWKKAVDLLKSGKEIWYAGASNRGVAFDDNGDPKFAYYVFWTVKDGKVAYTNSSGNVEEISLDL